MDHKGRGGKSGKSDNHFCCLNLYGRTLFTYFDDKIDQ